MEQKVIAVAKNVRISPQKINVVAESVRGMKIERAIDILSFGRQKGHGILKKVVHSAVANAEHNHGMDIDDLVIKIIDIGHGPRIKRWRARAKGRSTRIIKQTSHITVILTEGRGN